MTPEEPKAFDRLTEAELREENAALRAEVVRLEDCRQHLQREVADQTGQAIRNRGESNKRGQRIADLEAELAAVRAERDAAVEAVREAEWEGFSPADIPTCPVCDGNGLHSHTCSIGNVIIVADTRLRRSRGTSRSAEPANYDATLRCDIAPGTSQE